MQLIDRELVKVAYGKTKILVLQVPVQHGKSLLGSIGNAVWTLGRFPDRFVVAISHTQPFARDHIGANTRRLFESYGQQYFGLTIDRRSDASDRWNITGHGGGFYCDGTGGNIEGRRIDLGIIDDPQGTVAEAKSERAQEALYEWYLAQFVPRLSPTAGVIVIMSRWSKTDFVGRLIDAGNSGSGVRPVVVDLPAIALPASEYAGGADPLGRQPGEALWPEVRPREFLDRQRSSAGERVFAARFQGRPGNEQGSFFQREHFRYYEYEPQSGSLVYSERLGEAPVTHRVRLADLRTRQFVDLATSLKAEADYFVVTTVGIDNAQNLFILNVTRRRVPGPEQVPLLEEEFRTWRPERIMIEAVGYQLATVQSAIAKGLPAFPIARTRGDKTERANYAAVRYEQGAIFHPRTAIWLREFEDELISFPRGRHDDMTDTVSDAANSLVGDDDGEGPAGAYIA